MYASTGWIRVVVGTLTLGLCSSGRNICRQWCAVAKARGANYDTMFTVSAGVEA